MKLSGTARKNGVYLIFKREYTHITRILYSAYFTFHQYNLGKCANIEHRQNPNFMILDHLQIDVNYSTSIFIKGFENEPLTAFLFTE